jgi:hypothetical protein
MSNNKKYFSSCWLVIVCFFINVSSHAQKRGEYSLIGYTGGGISFFAGDAGTPSDLNTELSKTKPIGTLRLMWQPDHLLSVGLETGVTNFYSYKIQDNVNAEVQVKAVPFLIVFSMPLAKNLRIFAGPGGYFITSKLNYQQETNSNTFSLGWMIAGSYSYPISKACDIATEFKWLNARETKDGSLSLQVLLKWKILTW